jgi:zinc transport system permease protein
MGHALVEGQLYFASWTHLAAVVVLILLVSAALPSITPRIVRARLFPGLERANRLPAWRWHVGFDLLVALGMAVGTGTLGLMGAFSLAFVPPLIAFRLAPSWRACQWSSPIIGFVAFLLAFVVALELDQPFGPVLVAVLVMAAGLAELGYFMLYRRAGTRDAAASSKPVDADLGGEA